MPARVAIALIALLLSGCGGPPPSASDTAAAAKAAAEATAAAAPPPGPPRNVDANAQAFPPGYVGEDFVALKREFDAKVKAAEKTKYETTAQYEKRIADLGAVLAPIDVKREYAFKLTTLDYDADKGSYGNWYVEACHADFHEGSVITCQLAPPILTEDSTYVGSNAFGTTRVVKRQYGDMVSAAFDPKAKTTKKVFGGDLPWNVKWRCKVDPAKAQSLDGKTISLLLVGRIARAEHDSGAGELETAKITDDEPRDVWLKEPAMPIALTQVICYVEQTGEILQREKL